MSGQFVFQPLDTFAVACLSDDTFWYQAVKTPLLVVGSPDDMTIPDGATLVVHRPVIGDMSKWHVTEKECGARITGAESEDQIAAVILAIEAIKKFGVQKYKHQLAKHKADNERRME